MSERGPPAPWRVLAPTGPQAATSTAAPAVDLDPRTRTLVLGLQPRSGGSSDLWSGARVRHHLPEDLPDPVDWAPALAWLHGDEAARLLLAISQGYEVDMSWSGDWTARWQPEALAAVRDLLDHLARVLAPA